MKKIVMLNSMSFLPYQGRYLRIYHEAKELVDAGYEVTLIAWDRECRSPLFEKIDGILVERIPLSSEMAKGPMNIHKHLIFNLLLIRRLWNRPVDIIHCFNPDTVPAGLMIAKLRRKKITLDLCEPEYYRWWPEKQMFLADLINTLEKKLSPFFDYVFVHNLHQIRKFQSYNISKLHLISSVPGQEMMLNNIGQRSTRKKKHVVLGRIGTVYPNQGNEETIEAAKLLIERGNPIKLFFAGKVLESYETEFQAMIEPIKKHVTISGAFDISEMPALYKKIDLSLQIYKRTPFVKFITPTKFFESLGNGVPVVATDTGDCRELIEKHSCGIIVNEYDPQGMCEAIEELIKDRNKIDQMAKAGLKFVKNEYCWEVMAQRLLKAFQEISS